MFTDIRPSDRSNLRGTMPTVSGANRLEGALSRLPAPWRGLRNRRARAADGPPWVKFIVLHPGKGIALVDLLPARPDTAIAPLDEFLALTGFAAFSRGDPPIVALAFAEDDFAEIEDRLDEAFTSAPPCGIQNADWTGAVVELLMSTPTLLLTPLTPMSDRQHADKKSTVAFPETALSEATAHPVIAGPRQEFVPVKSAPLGEDIAAPRPTRVIPPHVDAEPEGRTKLRLEPRSPQERREAPSRSMVPWIAACSLSLIAAIILLYPHAVSFLSNESLMIESKVSAPDASSAIPPVAALPEEKEIASTTAPKDADPVAPAPSAFTPSIQPLPTEPESSATPRLEPDTGIFSRSPVVEQPIAPSPPVMAAPIPLPDRRVAEARAKSADGKIKKRDRPARDQPISPPAEEETVTIDGMTYVSGREPRSLGVVTGVEPETEAEPAPSP